MNNTGGWHHGPPPPPPYGRKEPRAGDSSPPKTPGFTFVANNLTVKFMDLFFGTAVILILYKVLLMISYMMRVKLAERKNKLLAGDEIKDGLGCISGNYGYPIKKSWVAYQTLLLSLCIFTAKVMMYRVCSMNVDTIHAIQQSTLFWAKPMNPLLRLFLLGLGVPFIFISSQLILLDYNLRYRYQRYGKFDWSNEVEEYPLVELSLGAIKDDDDEERNLALDQHLIGTGLFTESNSGSGSNSADSELVTAETSVPNLLPQNEPREFTRVDSLSSGDSDDHSSSRSSTDISSIYSMSSDVSSTASTGPVSGFQLNRMGMRYGVVTASLLNMAAVSATASMRPGLFGNINTATETETASESSLATDSIDGVDDEDDLYEESGDLPSYDDSQRQQQALLKNTRLSAQQQALISELKR